MGVPPATFICLLVAVCHLFPLGKGQPRTFTIERQEECGGKIFATGSRYQYGQLVSPNFPRAYLPGSRCTWTLVGFRHIILYLAELATRGTQDSDAGASCEPEVTSDNLTIQVGNTTHVVWCGQLDAPGRKRSYLDLLTDGSDVTVTFQSSESATEDYIWSRGFVLGWAKVSDAVTPSSHRNHTFVGFTEYQGPLLQYQYDSQDLLPSDLVDEIMVFFSPRQDGLLTAQLVVRWESNQIRPDNECPGVRPFIVDFVKEEEIPVDNYTCSSADNYGDDRYVYLYRAVAKKYAPLAFIFHNEDAGIQRVDVKTFFTYYVIRDKDTRGGQLVNVAYGKPAAQISNNSSLSGKAPSAVDGRGLKAEEKGPLTCSRTADYYVPDRGVTYWYVDLLRPYVITAVRITTYYCCGYTLGNFSIFVTNDIKLQPEAVLCHHLMEAVPLALNTTREFRCNTAPTARYVRLEKRDPPLALCEVQVLTEGFGPALYNLAQDKPTSQSSRYSGRLLRSCGQQGADPIAPAGTGYRADGYCDCTDTEDKTPWWSVDLEDVYDIYYVVIHAGEELTGRIKIVAQESQWTAEGHRSVCFYRNVSTPTGASVRLDCHTPARGRFVRIEKGGSFLQLCYVEVYGKVVEAAYENVALHKTVEQSEGGRYTQEPVRGLRDSRGQNQHCSVSKAGQPDPFWQVDLWHSYNIYEVIVTCSDAEDSVLTDLRIDIYLSDKSLVQTHKYLGVLRAGSTRRFHMSPPVFGQIVRISQKTANLILCGVEVMVKVARNVAERKHDYDNRNIALHKPAYQSSTVPGMPASLAVDGVKDRLRRSCTETEANDTSPWWLVDLEDEYIVNVVIVTNTDDVNMPHSSNTLGNFEIFIYGAGEEARSPENRCVAVRGYLRPGETHELPCTGAWRTGRYVLIRKNSPVLKLCEVQAIVHTKWCVHPPSGIWGLPDVGYGLQRWEGFLTGHNHTYDSYTACTKDLLQRRHLPDSRFLVQLYVRKLDVEDSPACLYDYLRVGGVRMCGHSTDGFYVTGPHGAQISEQVPIVLKNVAMGKRTGQRTSLDYWTTSSRPGSTAVDGLMETCSIATANLESTGDAYKKFPFWQVDLGETLNIYRVKFSQGDNDCPPGFPFRFGSKCYFVSTERLQYTAALTKCQDMQGFLAEPRIVDTIEFLKRYLTASGASGYYIGGYKATRLRTGWKWRSDNSFIPIPFANWAPGEPSNRDTDRCLVLSKTTGFKWDGVECSTEKRGYVCQTDRAGSSTPEDSGNGDGDGGYDVIVFNQLTEEPIDTSRTHTLHAGNPWTLCQAIVNDRRQQTRDVVCLEAPQAGRFVRIIRKSTKQHLTLCEVEVHINTASPVYPERNAAGRMKDNTNRCLDTLARRKGAGGVRKAFIPYKDCFPALSSTRGPYCAHQGNLWVLSLGQKMQIAAIVVKYHNDPVCPEGFPVRLGSNCYFISNGTATMDTAMRSCIQKGGILAEPRTEEVMNDLRDYLMSQPDRAQAGGYFLGGSSRGWKDLWRWQSDNSTIDASPASWSLGQPDSALSTGCLLMDRSTGYSWTNTECSTRSYNYICQADVRGTRDLKLENMTIEVDFTVDPEIRSVCFQLRGAERLPPGNSVRLPCRGVLTGSYVFIRHHTLRQANHTDLIDFCDAKVMVVSKGRFRRNVALHKPTFHMPPADGSDVVVDGEWPPVNEKSFTCTSWLSALSTPAPQSWVVHLETFYDIYAVVVTAGEQLTQFQVLVYDDDPSKNPAAAVGTFCAAEQKRVAWGQMKRYDCRRTIRGRYVRLFRTGAWLQLCEVQVLAFPAAGSSSTVNLALYRYVRMSSTHSASTEAGLSVDGSRYDSFRTCALTERELLPWWQVDLGFVREVHALVITPSRSLRCVTCSDTDYIYSKVSVKTDAWRGSVQLSFTPCFARLARLVMAGTTKIDCFRPAAGRYVTIERLTAGSEAPLALCEVEVLGRPVVPAIWFGVPLGSLDIAFESDAKNTGYGFSVVYDIMDLRFMTTLKVCGGEMALGTPVTSPGFHDNKGFYGEDYSSFVCHWDLQVNLTGLAIVEIHHLDLAPHPSGLCFADIIVLRNAKGDERVVCNTTSQQPRPFHLTFNITEGEMFYVTFIVRTSIAIGRIPYRQQATGFSLTVSTAIDCDKNPFVKPGSGYIASPNYPYPYPPNYSCQTRILVDFEGFFLVLFEELQLDGEGPPCAKDRLTFQWVSVVGKTVSISFCTRGSSVDPLKILAAKGTTINVTFESDSSDEGAGFKFLLQEASGPCPENFPLSFRHDCFFISTKTAVNWFAAQGVCKAKGGFLAEPVTDDINEFLMEKLSERSRRTSSTSWYYLGGTDRQEEGEWLWHSTRTPIPVSSDNWGYDFPSRSEAAIYNGDCMLMAPFRERWDSPLLVDRWVWKDKNCFTLRPYQPFICQATLHDAPAPCGGVLTTGTIVNPDYPDVHSRYSNCTWYISTQEDYVTLHFKLLELDFNPVGICSNCGILEARSEDSLGHNFHVRLNQISLNITQTVILHKYSRASLVYAPAYSTRGKLGKFKLHFTAEPGKYVLNNETICGQTDFTLRNGTLSTTLAVALPDSVAVLQHVRCDFTFRLEPGHSGRLWTTFKFLSLAIQRTSKPCMFLDFLKLVGGYHCGYYRAPSFWITDGGQNGSVRYRFEAENLYPASPNSSLSAVTTGFILAVNLTTDKVGFRSVCRLNNGATHACQEGLHCRCRLPRDFGTWQCCLSTGIKSTRLLSRQRQVVRRPSRLVRVLAAIGKDADDYDSCVRNCRGLHNRNDLIVCLELCGSPSMMGIH